MTTADLSNSFNPGSAGVTFAYQTTSAEDEAFNGGSSATLYQQRWAKFAPGHAANINQTFANSGAGCSMEAPISKAPDYLGTCYLVSKWLAIKPNKAAGITSTSWVNGRGYYAVLDATIRVSTALIHSTDGLTMFVLTDLFGLMSTYGALAGVYNTKEDLERSSRQDQVMYANMLGWSFAEAAHPERSWSVGGIAYHPIVAKINTRPLSQLVINYNEVGSNNGIFSLPLLVGGNGNSVVTDKSIAFQLAIKSIWGGSQERDTLVHGTNEVVFREYLRNPPKTIPASTTTTKVDIDIDARGPVTCVMMTVRSRKDIQSNNWTKDCNDQGGLYVGQCMFVTGNVAVEDGLPADFYSRAKVADAYQSNPIVHTALWSFENNGKSAQMTGHLTTTNMDRVRVSMEVFPHADDLVVDIVSGIYNGWYTENGGCTRVWN